MTDNFNLYTITEVAKILKVTERTIYNYVKAGTIPAAKIGKNWRIKGIDLEKFINDSLVN